MSEATCEVPAGIVIAELAGPALLGYQFNWALFGILIIQVYMYSQAGFNDNRLTRSLVYGVFLIEILQSALMAHDSFEQLAVGWGNYEKLTSLDYDWLTLPVITGLTSAAIQSYYAWRIYILSHSKIVPSVVLGVALMQCAAAFVEGILAALGDDDTANTQTDYAKAATIWLSGSVACDIIITVSMVYYLVRSRTGFGKTNSLIDSLIIYVVQTGLATTLLSTIELILFYSFKDNWYYFTPSCMVSKVYSNTLMVLLNNRPSIRAASSKGASTLTSGVFFPSAIREQERDLAMGVTIESDKRIVVDDATTMVSLPKGKRTARLACSP